METSRERGRSRSDPPRPTPAFDYEHDPDEELPVLLGGPSIDLYLRAKQDYLLKNDGKDRQLRLDTEGAQFIEDFVSQASLRLTEDDWDIESVPQQDAGAQEVERSHYNDDEEEPQCNTSGETQPRRGEEEECRTRLRRGSSLLRRLSEPALERLKKEECCPASGETDATDSDYSSADDDVVFHQNLHGQTTLQCRRDSILRANSTPDAAASVNPSKLVPMTPLHRSQKKLEHIFGENVNELLQPTRSKHKLARVLGEVPGTNLAAMPDSPSWMAAVLKLLHRNHIDDEGNWAYRLSRRKPPTITVTPVDDHGDAAGQLPRGSTGSPRDSVGSIIVSSPTKDRRSFHVDFEFSWHGDDPVSQFELCAKLGQGYVTPVSRLYGHVVIVSTTPTRVCAWHACVLAARSARSTRPYTRTPTSCWPSSASRSRTPRPASSSRCTRRSRCSRSAATHTSSPTLVRAYDRTTSGYAASHHPYTGHSIYLTTSIYTIATDLVGVLRARIGAGRDELALHGGRGWREDLQRDVRRGPGLHSQVRRQRSGVPTLPENHTPRSQGRQHPADERGNPQDWSARATSPAVVSSFLVLCSNTVSGSSTADFGTASQLRTGSMAANAIMGTRTTPTRTALTLKMHAQPCSLTLLPFQLSL